MMTKIKYALAFLWGGAFATCIWLLVMFKEQEWSGLLGIPIFLFSLGLILLIINFFIENWNQK